MGVLIECPGCKRRNSPKKGECNCGLGLKKVGGKTYWVEYYDGAGKRRRERIGPSRQAAEHRLREVLKARTEDRHIDKDKGARLSLRDLTEWYQKLTEVKAKASYKRDLLSITHLQRILGESTKIRDLTPGRLEAYQMKRASEPSPVHPGQRIKPATVNRELACLRTMINKAVKHAKLNENPMSGFKMLPENNVRKRILTGNQFEALLEACDHHLRPVVLMAYYMAMRKSEILFLTWGEVDLQAGFVRLKGDRTKTKVARSIPIHPRVKSTLVKLPRPIHTDRVFLRRGRPFNEIKKSFKAACNRAEIEDFTFHDLRHCAVNALRLAGNDYFKVMAVSGHKTMSVFKRYNLVTEDELSSVTWLDASGNSGH